MYIYIFMLYGPVRTLLKAFKKHNKNNNIRHREEHCKKYIYIKLELINQVYDLQTSDTHMFGIFFII